MKPRLESTPPPVPSRPPSPGVVGLDGAGDRARVLRRRRRLRNRVRSGFLLALALAAIVAGAWVGYQFYADQQDGADMEPRVRQATAERGDETLIVVIQSEPVVNGP